MLFVFVIGILVLDLWYEHDRILPLQIRLNSAERLSKQTLDTVALDALAVFFTDGNPHAHTLRRAV